MVTVTQNKNTRVDNGLKVLVLVGSSGIMRYPMLEQLQMETWDSIEVPGVETVYYRAGEHTHRKNKRLFVKGGEESKEIFTRTSLALKELLKDSWDFVFKTNPSSYVNKPRLYELLCAMPRQRFYGGKLYHPRNSVPDKDNFMWGCGYVLSRDMAELIAKDHGEVPYVDDIHIPKILNGRAPYAELPFYNYFKDKLPIPINHIYRCKNADKPDFWDDTAKAITHVHKHLTQNYYGKEGRARQSGQHQEKTQEESQQKRYTRKDKTVNSENQQAIYKAL